MAVMREDARHAVFVGRRHELQVLADLAATVRNGRSASLILRADPGMGKTYLLSRVLDVHADRMRVLSVTGVESEMVLDYAGLQQVCAPLMGHSAHLPALQKHALQVAMGVETGALPNPFLVGLAMVNVLSEAGADRATLCIIDDAQWIDDLSRQAFGFAARRLLADPVGFVFATRAGAEDDHLGGVTEMVLRPLGDADSRALLEASLPGRLDPRVRERLLTEAGGNPLALTELPRVSTPGELAGGFGLGRGTSLTSGLERAFAHRFEALAEPTRTLLLLAAAEPVGEPAWLWAAAERLGVTSADAAPAETAGLVTVGTRVSFRHPLVRSAVYRSSPVAQRRLVHAALAETITGSDATDFRAWHRAHATSTPREDVASALVDSAERARLRGGIAAAAAFLEYAVELTPDMTVRARRAVDAGAAKLDAGDTRAAAALVELAAGTARDRQVLAHVALLRAKLAFATDRGRETPQLLLRAARELAEFDAELARDTYLEALMAAMVVGRLATDGESSPERIARAALDAPPAPSPPRAVDLLLEGLIARFAAGYVAAAPLLKEALHAYLRDVHAGNADPRWHDITNRICLDLFDFANYQVLAFRQLRLLREAGELTVLPAALATAAAVCVLDGDFAQAEALLDEAFVASTATGAPPHNSMQPFLAAYRGDERLWRSGAQTAMSGATERGEGTEVTVVLYAKAVLHNGLSRYADALDACREGWQYSDIGLYVYLLVEAVEAAACSGDRDAALECAARLARCAGASPTESAMGLSERCRSLASGDEEAADDHFRQAITHLERSPLVMYLARTHLVYGEWLRRRRRTGDARTQLRLALAMFTTVGAEAFRKRAMGELEAAGGAVTSRGHRYDTDLTAQERQISRLVRHGDSNAEIAAQLFISHRTVEWHLRNVYGKLGVSSRRELRRLVSEDE
jgi:DNA-binding CsgD family transcriptional regulator